MLVLHLGDEKLTMKHFVKNLENASSVRSTTYIVSNDAAISNPIQ